MTMQLLDGPFLSDLKSALTALISSQDLSVCKLNMKLHQKSCPNLHVINESIEDIVNTFWMEFKSFQTNRFPFDYPDQFSTKDALTGKLCIHCLTLEYLDLLPAE